MNGMKVVKLSIPRAEAVSLREKSHDFRSVDEGRRSKSLSRVFLLLLQEKQEELHPIKSSPSPPLVKVKDEPIDEEYEQALVSSTSTASVKDEPNTAKVTHTHTRLCPPEHARNPETSVSLTSDLCLTDLYLFYSSDL